MSKAPKRDWIELFEKRIEDLEAKINGLEEHLRIVNRQAINRGTIGIHIAYLLGKRPVPLKAFDTLMGLIRGTEEDLETYIERSEKSVYVLPAENYMSIVIGIAKLSKIPFEKLVPYLIDKLGKKLAKRIVKKEIILKHYGSEGFTIWELLLKKGS